MRQTLPTTAIRTATRAAWVLVLAACLAQTGCINTLVMVGKVLAGDPLQTSAFEQATGVSLKKEEKQVLIHVSASSFLEADDGSLTVDVQEELSRRMKRQELQVVRDDRTARVLDRLGGTFDAQALAREIDGPDYLFHISIESFSYLENASPNLYRGHSAGRIIGYEVRGEGDSRHAVQVFDQRFQTTYPTSYPVSVDQTPKTVFIRRFVDHIADSLGASFYDVTRSSLYAN